MAQQTRRSPGRPKKAQAPQMEDTSVLEPPAPVKKKDSSFVKWEEKERDNKNVEYIIDRKAGIAYLVKQTNVTVYDKERDTVRTMRYCPNEPSIWMDEQSSNAVRGSIVFRSGRLFVRAEQPNLRKFMELHPDNELNGGNVFRIVDKTKDAEEELVKEFEVYDAVSKVRDTDITDLIPVAMFFGVNTSAKSSEIRHNLLRIAKRSPQNFIEAFDSPQVKTRAMVQQCFDYQILTSKSNGCYWHDSNKLIVSTPAGMDTLDVMTRFCLTEKGSLVLDRIESELAKL
jgi:hypothetical protein